MSHLQDRGLAAVRRVRGARERDSRIGLQQALAAARQRADEASTAAQRVAQVPVFEAGAVGDFHRHVLHTTTLAAAAGLAADRAEGSRLLAEEASGRWQRERTALRVADLLLERRAEQRAAEQARREAAELDDLAAQGWLRARSEEGRSR